MQRDLPWELNSSLQTVGRTDLGGTVGAVGKPNFGSHFRVFTEDDGSKRLVGTSFDEDLRQGKLTFFEYNERMELLYRTTAELPVLTLPSPEFHYCVFAAPFAGCADESMSKVR